MRFWKFETPAEEQVQFLVTEGGLPPSVSVPGLKNTFDAVARKLRPGDGVVLASLHGDEGKIIAFGKVRGIDGSDGEISIQWAKASHGILPTGSGLEHWETKTAFEISKQPAERYGLQRFIDFHVKDVKV